jgi:hypothetical protein
VPPAESDLDEIRRAAFELRQRDPSEAVRILRRMVKRGGDVEALAHGALAEILLDDFDDIDGALHHFQRLLVLAPGMPAGELGHARALARNDDVPAAQKAYARALEGFEKLARKAMQTKDAEELDGIDETILTALELAVEERELLHETGHGGKPQTQPSVDILYWAETERVFDPDEDEEGDLGDWLRYTQLRAVLAALDKKLPDALNRVEHLAKYVPLPPEELPRLRSFAHEAARDVPSAAEEALQAIRLASGLVNPDDALRAASLLTEVERLADAHGVLRQLEQQLQAPHAASTLPPELRQELLGQVKERLQDLAPPGLVSLGRGFGKADK